MKTFKKEIHLTELGYFSRRDCEALKESMEGETFMEFHISWSSIAGNCTLIISTDYDSTEEKIKEFFYAYAVMKLARLLLERKWYIKEEL